MVTVHNPSIGLLRRGLQLGVVGSSCNNAMLCITKKILFVPSGTLRDLVPVVVCPRLPRIRRDWVKCYHKGELIKYAFLYFLYHCSCWFFILHWPRPKVPKVITKYMKPIIQIAGAKNNLVIDTSSKNPSVRTIARSEVCTLIKLA